MALHKLFRRAILDGTAAHYGPEERAAWAGDAAVPPAWSERLSDGITLVSECTAPPIRPKGFMTLRRDGYLDLAFVAPEVMGTGVAAALYDHILRNATRWGLARLTTDASFPARRFFLKRGWTTIAEQRVERYGVFLTNFRMEKILHP